MKAVLDLLVLHAWQEHDFHHWKSRSNGKASDSIECCWRVP
jgi:hypothetical protein